MTSLTDVKRESQGNQPIYYNGDEKGVSLGVLHFALGDVNRLVEAAKEIAEDVAHDYDTQFESSGKLLLIAQGLRCIADICNDINPGFDARKRDFHIERHSGEPMTIAFEGED